MTPRLSPRLNRRQFLLASAALGLAACSDGGQATRFDLGSGSRLRILNWADYVDVDEAENEFYAGGTLAKAQSQLAMSIDYSTDYSDNIDGWQLLIDSVVNVDSPRFDIVVPTNWRAAQMIENGWAEPLPLEVIPNHSNIDPAFLTNAWDRGCRYQMPWQAGITGIAYNPKLTGRELTSIDDLFDPEFAGKVGFIGETREAVGLAMLSNGDDPSRPTVAAANRGLEKILKANSDGQIGAVTFEDFAPKLDTGELVAAMAWSGDTALLQSTNPDIEFIIPQEGAIQWFDTMVIPAGSPNVKAAGKFMNFVYNPENAAQITEFVQYISPVLGVQQQLLGRGSESAKIARSPILFPDASNRNRLFTWGGLDQAAEDSLDERFAPLVP